MRTEFGATGRAGDPAQVHRFVAPVLRGLSTSAFVQTRNRVSLDGALALARSLHARYMRRLLNRCATAVASTVRDWAARSRSRLELLELNDRALLDVGLTRSDVWREGSKPFWRA